MDITPSPRILRMLGEIEFDEWQCIAELIDNAFDDFTDLWQSGASWPGGYQVSVALPGRELTSRRRGHCEGHRSGHEPREARGCRTCGLVKQ